MNEIFREFDQLPKDFIFETNNIINGDEFEKWLKQRKGDCFKMQEIKRYLSILRYGKKETLNVLNENSNISITEKLDGANAQFYTDGVELYLQSRNTVVNEDNTLRGFYNWAIDVIKPVISKLNPSYRYFGEWLCPHTVKYKDSANYDFYLFSVYDSEKDEYLSDDIVIFEANKLGLKTVPYFYRGKFISIEHLESFIGKSDLSLEKDNGEGIVIKDAAYKDTHGNQIFIKMVTEKFLETKPIPKPKIKKEDPSAEVIKSIVTKARVEKIMHKLIDENLLSQDELELENMSKLIKVTCKEIFDDIYKEEADLLSEFESKKVSKIIGRIIPNIIKKIIS